MRDDADEDNETSSDDTDALFKNKAMTAQMAPLFFMKRVEAEAAAASSGAPLLWQQWGSNKK